MPQPNGADVGNAVKRRTKKIIFLAAALAGPLLFAGVYIHSRFHFFAPIAVNSTGGAASPKFNNPTGVLGQSVYGSAQSRHYRNSGGVVNQTQTIASPPAANLSDAYVYPNPFKPNSPGRFKAAKLTFKNLPAEATIRIFTITGKQVAELRKTESTGDNYEWNATNDYGQKLASGVYIFFITSPGGGKAKGKFAIIR